MITTPNIEQLIEGVIVAIGNDILPNLDNDKAVATAAMAQSVLAGVCQMLPQYDRNIVQEHNEMAGVLRDAAAALGDASGDAADRVRERGAGPGSSADLPDMPDVDANRAAHRALSTAIADSLADLDELIRADVAGADDALQIVRGHLGPRCVRFATAISVEGGMIGRG
jgi:hypothetical protein